MPRRRGRPSSPAPVSPPDNDNLLSEILLRLPPVPSSLPRASLVCKHWRRLVTDPAFVRRFRARHIRDAPLLGFFAEGPRGVLFTPTLKSPNRVPSDRFPFQFDAVDEWGILGCSHGLVLLLHSKRHQVVVWDPVTGDQRRIDVPPGFGDRETAIEIYKGAVLRASSDVHGGGHQSSPFQVVLLGHDQGYTRAFVCVYSSETGVWGDPISIACPLMFATFIPGTLVGNSLYWSLLGDSNSIAILEFDLDSQRLELIDIPHRLSGSVGGLWVVPVDSGVLGFLYLSNHSIYLWKREMDCDGVAGWVLGRTIDLNNLLPLSSDEEYHPRIIGFAENDKLLLIWIADRIFSIQLESMKFVQFNIQLESMKFMQFRIGFETINLFSCHPFSIVYTAGMGLGDEHEGAEPLLNT